MFKSEKPNIILIMTDQQRADTISALGNDYMTTPNMDKLVNKGVAFRQAFSCGATCIASRAAMFTGMYGHNTGVYSFDRWSHNRTFVHDLRELGYHCVNIGKMHVSPRDDKLGFHERTIVENPTGNPLKKGGVDDDWGKYLSFHGKKRPIDRHITDKDWRNKYQGVPWDMDAHLHPDMFIGNSALAWINSHQQQKPVFLQIGFTGPHEPYSALPENLDLYENVEIPEPVIKEGELKEKPPQHQRHQEFHNTCNHESQIAMPEATIEGIKKMRKHYYASITTVDKKIGEVLNTLEEKGYLDNALVIFTSDHGDMMGDHQLAYKWLMYDSIVNIPLIIWDTNSSRQNFKVDQLASQIDIAPTILDFIGQSIPDYLDGKSLLPILNDAANKIRDYVYCEDNYQTMIRNKKYKMVYYTDQEDCGELYDLEEDPYELNNLFNEENYRNIKQKLKEDLLNWLLKSNYRTATYKNKSLDDVMRWPEKDNYFLHGKKKRL